MSVLFPVQDGNTIQADEMNASFYQTHLGNTMDFGAVDITTSATQIRSANSNRKGILIYNKGTEEIYLGQSSVTTTSGFKLEAGESIYLYNKEEIYAISSSATNNIRFIEVQ